MSGGSKIFEIPKEERIQFIEGYSDAERQSIESRLREELSERYGAEGLKQIRFVAIRWESLGDRF